MNAFEWTQASSVDQALAGLNEDAVFKAGGVDLMDMLKERLIEPPRVVNLRTINELDYVEEDANGGLRIGPLVTLAKVAAHPKVKSKWAILADAVGRAATPQIRNMATLGGNLLQRPRCWYFRSEQFPCRRKGGEICFSQEGENQYHAIFDNKECAIVHPSAASTPLVALGGSVVLKNTKGQREVPAEKFFVLPQQDVHNENILQPGEILTEIKLPAPAQGSQSAYVRQGEKESFDWPLAEVAVVIERDGDVCRKASVVLGAAAPAPHRAAESEAILANQRIDEALATKAAKAAMAGARPMTQNGYKLQLFETLIRRTILAAVGIDAVGSTFGDVGGAG
jgi:xanthine dehydrogenase YagS FAD-binding subunit